MIYARIVGQFRESSSGRVHSPKGANFDSRFVSREGAKNAKERACDGFFVPSLEEVSSATEFRSLRVLRVLRVRNAFAPFGECTPREGRIRSLGQRSQRGRSTRNFARRRVFWGMHFSREAAKNADNLPDTTAWNLTREHGLGIRCQGMRNTCEMRVIWAPHREAGEHFPTMIPVP
jgi:hypothetical protein